MMGWMVMIMMMCTVRTNRDIMIPNEEGRGREDWRKKIRRKRKMGECAGK